jgi:hypothetical protein
MAISDIITRVQTEFDALGQDDWCDKDYILNFLAIHNEDVESVLENMDLSYDTQVEILPGVAAGTTDLSAFELAGQLLAQIMYPITLEWRLVGDTDVDWRPIPHVDVVEDVLAPTPTGPSATEGVASWEWRAGIIYISPSSVPTDIRVRFEALPALLNTDSAQYARGLTNVLVYGICEHIAMNRGGAASKLGLWFADKYEKNFGTVIDRLVKDEQTVPRRMGGRRSQQPGPLWRMPMG